MQTRARRVELNFFRFGKCRVSADVGQHHRLDGQPAHRAQLVPLLQLAGADVAAHQVTRPPVHDAAVLRPRLADEARVQTRLGQLPRRAAVQLGCGGGKRGGAGLLGVRGGRLGGGEGGV